MTTSKLIKATSISILSLGLTLIPFSISASAQDTTNPDGIDVEDIEDVQFDWGWLGLLGLLGLAGLAGRKRDNVHHQRHDPRADRPANYQTNSPASHQSAPDQPDAPLYRDPYRDPK